MTAPLTVHLIRHADAVPTEDAHGSAERALTARGNAQARTLAWALTRSRARVQRVCSSPRLRAVQTAEALRAPGGPAESAPLVVLEEMATGGATATIRAVLGALGPGESRVALVGHEPHLGELAAYLLVGRENGLRIAVRKASVLELEGDLRGGGMTLRSFVPVQLFEALTGGALGPEAP